MTDQEFSEILEAVVARTNHEPFRYQSDPKDPRYIPGIRDSIVMIYEGRGPQSLQGPPLEPEPFQAIDIPYEPAEVPKHREQIRRQRAIQGLARECPYREVTPGCGCQGVKCWARYGGGSGGERANQAECEACVSALVRFEDAVSQAGCSTGS